MTETVRLFNAAMDDTVAEGTPLGIVLRGSLDLGSLDALRVDDYQREEQKYSAQKNIRDALDHGQLLPDVELGMRGQHYTEREDNYTLRDAVYIIDGLQRISTIKEWMKQNPDKTPRLGAVVHFNTDEQWERIRFQRLNNNRKRVSPSVLLRNMRNDNRAILTLYGLCVNEQSFPLYDKVCWQQNMRRSDLITALMLLKVAGQLHSHVNTVGRVTGARIGKGNAPEAMSITLLRRMEIISMNTMRKNVHTFFSVIEELWGIRDIQYKDENSHMRGTFLKVLAKLFSEHTDFWRGEQLFVSLNARAKIKKFALNDPEVRRLCGSGGSALDILYYKMTQHFNSGKRTHRLHPRTPTQIADAG